MDELKAAYATLRSPAAKETVLAHVGNLLREAGTPTCDVWVNLSHDNWTDFTPNVSLWDERGRQISSPIPVDLIHIIYLVLGHGVFRWRNNDWEA